MIVVMYQNNTKDLFVSEALIPGMGSIWWTKIVTNQQMIEMMEENESVSISKADPDVVIPYVSTQKISKPLYHRTMHK